MGFKLENVVPWGRSQSEYISMFNLTPNDLRRTILDCAGGSASFNAEITDQGGKVISCDPLYQFTATEIAQRIDETYPIIINGVKSNLDSYVWQEITSPEQLGEVRMKAMRLFLEDYPHGLQTGRYLPIGLPEINFTNNQFDLALCSHFLFTYSEQFSTEFHRKAIANMCEVAAEVRIFPLLTISGEPSPHLIPVMDTLKNQGYQLEIQKVAYEFQKQGNQLLRILR